MGKTFLQTSIKDSLFTGLIALALFGPVVGLRTVAKNEILVVQPKWLIVLLIVTVCTVGRFFINLYTYKRDLKTGIQSSIGKSITNFLDTKGTQIALSAIIFSLIFPFLPFTDRYLMDIAIMMLTYIMLGWGLNIVIGLAGLLDLGYVAFYAVGAYSYALFAIHFGWSFWICLPIAGVFAAMFGVLLGFPVLRLRGDYLAIVTLAFGEMIRILLLNWYELTKGPDGLTGIPRPSFFGLPFKSFPEEGEKTFHTFFGLEYDPMQRIIFLYYLILFLALVTNLFTIKIRRLPIGRAWEALREDEIACKSLGVNPRNTKLTAFAIGAMFGGFAGSFFATRQAFISPESFTFIESAIIVAIVVLGGMGSQTGVVLSTVFLIGLIEVFRDFESYRMIAFGGAMVLIMIFRPRGILATRKPTIILNQKK
ncbi:MAG: high-affinity branched-chain amino acid ABC transporter permease LivM [Candidatus Pelagibacter sp. TMED153]|nr:MAG: high-affinity branched-chain amino acid ABC transporter permease LivM [Candidatus Pelagibacter sp. TMED153]|tara:strand:- start:2058 stop:3326 length:1269 start_codon:yes stop_codon:yes gene_type:complete